ncbi:unnamed protein product [Sphagnum jensenii]|uniref:Uncharacterized protein n=1 Tax=Sphagnum jensenii TaxID=128206 RepID=A0ABP1BHE5_9BRYO
MLAARQSHGHELALEELNAGTRGTSNRDIFSADMVAATRRNGGTQPSQSATPLKAGMASMWLSHEQNIMITSLSCGKLGVCLAATNLYSREIIKETVIQGAVYFVTRQKRRVSATCFKRLVTCSTT